MKRLPFHSQRFHHLAVSVLGAMLLVACGTSPTGRTQLKLFPSDQVAQMGETAYAQMRKKERVESGTPAARYIDCVARAVVAVAPAPRGGGRWDVTTFESDQVNAFALPGGNIGVYTGLLKAARTPSQLAAVLGHEVAHVEAEHANARLSTQYAADAGLSIIQVLGQGTVLESQTAMAMLGLGTQVGVLLPFSRAQESEADVLGLDYMARAGFDPDEAVQLWRNMAEVGGGGGPAFLSTHPASESRIEALRKRMPKAREQYREARAHGRRPDCRAP
jgi:predicted Zn-dependent protease